MKWTPDLIDSVIKLIIGTTFCLVVLMMASLSMYSLVFVTQPFYQSPQDKQFFLLLSDLSKFVLGSLATLLAVKGKDALPMFNPPGLSKPSDFTDPQPPAPKAPAPVHAPVRAEPQLEAAPPSIIGYGGKKAPPPAPEPEI